jgi:hypothetical protein
MANFSYKNKKAFKRSKLFAIYSVLPFMARFITSAWRMPLLVWKWKNQPVSTTNDVTFAVNYLCNRTYCSSLIMAWNTATRRYGEQQHNYNNKCCSKYLFYFNKIFMHYSFYKE